MSGRPFRRGHVPHPMPLPVSRKGTLGPGFVHRTHHPPPVSRVGTSDQRGRVCLGDPLPVRGTTTVRTPSGESDVGDQLSVARRWPPGRGTLGEKGPLLSRTRRHPISLQVLWTRDRRRKGDPTSLYRQRYGRGE